MYKCYHKKPEFNENTILVDKMNPFIKMLLLIYLLSPDIISAFQFDDARFEIDFGVNPKKVEKLNLSLPPADLCLPTLGADDLLDKLYRWKFI